MLAIEVPSPAVAVIPRLYGENRQRERIIRALDFPGSGLPKVDEGTLSRYYKYLVDHLDFPFTAYYPEPTNSYEHDQFRCTALELLDPASRLGDEFDGIFCKVQKGRYEIELPLIELDLPPDSPNFQLVEDYWYWFWNWR
jgi:hypothetical protein